MKCSPGLVLFFIFSFVVMGTAQPVSTGQYLAGFRNNEALASFDIYADQVGGLKFGLPVADEINLRTETDQFNLSRQEYALRLMFNSWSAGHSYAGEKKWITEKIVAKKQMYGAELLLRRYLDLLDVYFVDKQIALLQSDSVFIDSMIQAEGAIIRGGAGNDIGDVLNWEEKKIDVYKKLTESRMMAELHKKRTGGLTFDWAYWPSVAFMESLLTQKENMVSLSEGQARSFNADSVLIRARWDVSRKNDHRLLDYAQLRYSKRDNLLFQDEFSIGLGFRLPFKGTQKKQANDYKLEQYELQQEKSLEIWENAEAVRNALLKFRLLSVQLHSLDIVPTTETTVNLDNPDVYRMYVTEKKKRSYELAAKKLELEEKIAIQYLTTLYLMGELEKTPSTNFLSTLLPSF